MLRLFRDKEYFKANIVPLIKTLIGLYIAVCFGVWVGLLSCQLEHPGECHNFWLNPTCSTSGASAHN